MSNFLAIATVTTALRDLLQAAVTGIGGTPTVTAGRPHAPAKLDPVVFLYLYSVTPNTSLRNNDLSTRRPDGRVQNRPQAAVDLRYLLSFYGDEGEQVPQQLMGKAVVALH